MTEANDGAAAWRKRKRITGDLVVEQTAKRPKSDESARAQRSTPETEAAANGDGNDHSKSKPMRKARNVDLDLAQIYDHLADESESQRLDAALKLLERIRGSQDYELIEKVLHRLFRGLCSTRKGARQGFSVALTELLSLISGGKIPAAMRLSSEVLLSILEVSTAVESGANKQEERDHAFGGVFGLGAIIASGIVIQKKDRVQWKRLLQLLCNISKKKPWLRQEVGWLLHNFVSTPDSGDGLFVEDVVEVLMANKLIKTPEGVAIWLAASKSYPQLQLSRHIWKHGHPLAEKNVMVLAEIMKDAKATSIDDDETQGSAIWSAKLHFAWKVVLEHMYKSAPAVLKPDGSISKAKQDGLVLFNDFWLSVVDRSLFGDSASQERKLWGVSVLAMAMETAPFSELPRLFSHNAMHCFITALRNQESYLRKPFEHMLEIFRMRVEQGAENAPDDVPTTCLLMITQRTNYVDVDALTRTKFVTHLLTSTSVSQRHCMLVDLDDFLRKQQASVQDQKFRTVIAKHLIDLQSKVLNGLIRDNVKSPIDAHQVARDHLLRWLEQANGNRLDPQLQDFVKARLEAALEQSIRAGWDGQQLLLGCVKEGILDKVKDGSIECDDIIRKCVTKAAKRLINLPSEGDGQGKSVSTGLSLLSGILVLDVVGGDPDALGSLQELLNLKGTTKYIDPADAVSIIEVILSLAPRPSKFIRTANQTIFQNLASTMTSEALESLTRVLLTKENAQGQQDMFEADGVDEVDSASGTDVDAEHDDLDSDVEAIDASENGSEGSPEDESSSNDEDDEEDGETVLNGNHNEDDLAALDAALASALGTRKIDKPEDDGESSESDADMDDEEMLALDDKLSAMFKARKEATNKKKERKDTKEAFINFKNRVLDLVEIYLKQESQNQLVIGLIVPLLQSIRITQTKQLSDRTSAVLKQFFKRAKGQRAPRIQADLADQTFKMFKEVHEEVCEEASNAHTALCSSASLLMAKALCGAGFAVSDLDAVCAATKRRLGTKDVRKAHQDLFANWESSKTSLGKQAIK